MQRLRVRPEAGLARTADALGAGDERRDGGVQRAGVAARVAAAVLELGEVLLDVRQRGLQALRRLEQGARAVEAPQLVERDAGVAEDDRLAGLLVERVESGLGDVGEELGGLCRRLRLAGGGQALLEQQHPRVVARAGVLLLCGAREQRAVAVDVAGDQQRAGLAGQRGAERAGCAQRNGPAVKAGVIGRRGVRGKAKCHSREPSEDRHPG